jgi:predicted DCC family thiol-disulfide oxidoreductase YuxK
MQADRQAIVLFDGVCNLCAGVVRFGVRHDPVGRLRFAALQSEAGRRLMREHGLDPDAIDTFVVIAEGRPHTASDAFLALSARLRFPWPLLRVLGLLPRRLRDALYGMVVRNRYRWFGRRETCLVPTPELAERFLD